MPVTIKNLQKLITEDPEGVAQQLNSSLGGKGPTVVSGSAISKFIFFLLFFRYNPCNEGLTQRTY